MKASSSGFRSNGRRGPVAAGAVLVAVVALAFLRWGASISGAPSLAASAHPSAAEAPVRPPALRPDRAEVLGPVTDVSASTSDAIPFVPPPRGYDPWGSLTQERRAGLVLPEPLVDAAACLESPELNPRHLALSREDLERLEEIVRGSNERMQASTQATYAELHRWSCEQLERGELAPLVGNEASPSNERYRGILHTADGRRWMIDVGAGDSAAVDRGVDRTWCDLILGEQTVLDFIARHGH